MAQYRLVLSAGGHDEADSSISMWAGAKLAMKDWVSMDVSCALRRALTVFSSPGSLCFCTFGSYVSTIACESPAFKSLDKQDSALRG